jgi:hypothetical protein
MTTDPLERPDHACLTCPPPAGKRAWIMADPKFKTCSVCYDRLGQMLRDIRTGYAALDPSPGSATGDGRGSPGFGSTPPANLHVITMTDPRSTTSAQEWIGGDHRVHVEPENPTLSVPGALFTLAWFIAGLREFDDPPVAVEDLTYWLARQLDWITRRVEVIGFWGTLRRLDSQIRCVLEGPTEREWLTRCPTCREKLWAPDADGNIRCAPCGKTWPRESWASLASEARRARLGLSA